MPQDHCLLVVIDPINETQPALQKAAIFAEKIGCEVTLLGCVYDEYVAGERFFDGPDLERLRSNMLDERLESLKALAAPLHARDLAVTCRVVWDRPLHEAIAREALEIHPDIVFKDTHHHSTVSRTLFTNTDWHLIRECPSTLWLVKQSPAPEHAAVMAAVAPTHKHDEPAALDHKIIEQAQILAAMFEDGPHLVHTYTVPTAAMVSNYSALPTSASGPPDYEHMVNQAKQYHADALVRLTKELDYPADRIHLRQGYAAEMLPKLAKELNAAVVVMGAVARSRLARAIIGSTAERTLDRFSCDVVIVKPDGFVSPVDSKSPAKGFVEKTEAANARMAKTPL
jgi:universal stress protein E